MSYLEELDGAIVKLHGCEGTHVASVPVREVFQGKVAWEGVVEVFKLTDDPKRGHPVAKHCYAWGYKNEKGGWEITTVLEIPPVVSPQTAVKAAIAAHARQSAPRRSGSA
jgi:hypothetical protein